MHAHRARPLRRRATLGRRALATLQRSADDQGLRLSVVERVLALISRALAAGIPKVGYGDQTGTEPEP